jgi:hypothetical protein
MLRPDTDYTSVCLAAPAAACTFEAYQSLLEVARAVGARVKLWSMEINPDTGETYFR